MSGDGEQKRWKKNLVAGRRPRKSAGYVMEVWLKENKQEGHACGTSVGGKGGGERLDAGKGVVVAANACITGERIGNRAASVDTHTHTHRQSNLKSLVRNRRWKNCILIFFSVKIFCLDEWSRWFDEDNESMEYENFQTLLSRERKMEQGVYTWRSI